MLVAPGPNQAGRPATVHALLGNVSTGAHCPKWPPDFTFNLPAGGSIGADGSFDFNFGAVFITPGPGNQKDEFAIHFALGPTGTIGNWVLVVPGPTQIGNLTFFEATFTETPSPIDAALTFSMTENGTPMAFQAIPEPASLALLGTGLVAGAYRWRKRTRLTT